ncbi:cadherin-like beta sandwich domain-containing protein [Paenibacillus senegalimassiliensis]|uniref:cadherin-like beta sandwich domain-containing protein n=1 Tax=Paenibacillus senegalimassiliensis TaxID=1737426 RepID=UPI0009EBA163|nr:cadherin-like beta sandwich domain-containing protein [Paenibacillus senegalimassiliensis]
MNGKFMKPWLALMIVVTMLLGGFPATGTSQAYGASDVAGTTYYVDDVGGNDSYTGTSEDQAWRTLERVNQFVFQPGDQILLRSGGIWEEQTLAPKGSGQANSPIRIDRYGIGDKPKIATKGKYNDALTLHNQQYWEIRNLNISNAAPVTGTFAESLGDYRGIHITGVDAGELQYFRIQGVEVHDVSGEIAWISGTIPTVPEPGIRFKTGWDGSKKTGGIVFDTTVSDLQNPQQATTFNDVIIEDSSVKNTSFGGIIFKQYAGDTENAVNTGWGTRTNEQDPNFTPHTNIIIRNNFITQKDTDYGCNAMYLTGVRDVMVEGNVVDGAGTSGIEAYYADQITIQYNEVFNTTKKAGGADSNGIDPDKATTNILIQYNYVHDNGDGILVCQFSFGSTTIRYNVIESNSRYPIYLHSDRQAVAEIYNNTIYNDVSNYLVYGYGSSLNATYNIRNNIFYTTRTVQELTTSPTITYDNNSYYSTNGSLAPPVEDLNALTANPYLVNPGSGTSGSEVDGPSLDSLSGYQLKPESVLINRGLNIIDTTVESAKDFAGNVLYNGTADPGTFEYYDESDTQVTIAGRVTNIRGKGISGAIIRDLEGNAAQAVTDVAGYYVIKGVTSGNQVHLKAERTGYSISEIGPFVAVSGNIMTKDMELSSESGTGSIRGEVKDGDLSLVSGATVTLTLDGLTVQEVLTDVQGQYLFTDVEIGEGYAVRVSKAQYYQDRAADIPVDPALTTSVKTLYLVSSEATLLSSSNFNQTPTGEAPGAPWAVSQTGGSIQIADIPDVFNKSVMLHRSSNSGSTSMSQTFSPGSLKGVVTLTADIMRPDNNSSGSNWISVPYIYSSAGTSGQHVGISLAFSKGKIIAYVGGSTTELMSYEANAWYHIRLVLNTDSAKFDFYIDNEKILDQANFRNPIPDIGRIEYYANSSNYGTIYMDNIKLYKGIPYDSSDTGQLKVTSMGEFPLKSEQQNYRTEVPYFVESIILNAEVSGPPISSLTINDVPAVSGQPVTVALAEGENSIPVTVTAQDGITVNTVYVYVNRISQSMDSTLQDLRISDDRGQELELAPAFTFNQDHYQLSVTDSVYSLRVHPVAGSPLTEVKVNGQLLDPDTQQVEIDLTGELSRFIITTASADGAGYQEYQIEIDRITSSGPQDATVTPAYVDRRGPRIGVAAE